MSTGSAQSSLDLVALVGAPNCGKTTLYNWLTNSKFKTVNYPGATVEYAIGQAAERLNTQFFAMDTPGTYSLFPKSSDEEVTKRALYETHNGQKVGKVICVVDGSQLERHLLLVQQIKEAGFSFVIVITMADLLKKNNLNLDIQTLKDYFSCEVILFDGVLGSGLIKIAQAIEVLKVQTPTELKNWNESAMVAKAKHIRQLARQSYGELSQLSKINEQTVRIDKWLLSPFFGLLIFFAIMSTLFSSIFWLAKPFMDGIDKLFSWSADLVLSSTSHALLADFLAHGLIASIGSVAIFTPQIFILFFAIGILESTGYLARAATLVDKPFSKIGLSGRSFIPILSGFACAVPAIMATRNISSKRDRMITNFIIPLMTCSARLPVYALLLNFIFKDAPPWKPGVALAALYMGSLMIGSLVAAILNRILTRSGISLFMMELPLYRWPRWKILFRQSLSRTKTYLFQAGPMIFTFAILIWAGTTFPNYNASSSAEKMETSYFASVGHALEPVFEPMGVDWRVGIGLMSAFAAREVFVSSMAIVFNITEKNDELQSKGILRAMHLAKMPDGTFVFNVASVVSLILFFMIALQCMSTFTVSFRENRSLRFALLQLILFNVVAYVLSVSVFQLLRTII